MKEDAKKLFMENYQNKGDCKDLPKFLKRFEKEFKKADNKVISYYPWAVIERLFRMQGGTIEVKNWALPVSFKTKDYEPDDDGELVLTEQETNALFIHLKATWEEETLEEFYPLFDNQSSKIIKTPNAMDLNTSRQRGSVRLISRLSGIGLDIFEQQDSQFEGEGDTKEEMDIKKKEDAREEKIKNETKKPRKTKAQLKKEADKKKAEEAMGEIVDVKDEPKYEKAKEPKEEIEIKEAKSEENEEGGSFLKGFLKGEEVDDENTDVVEDIKEEKKGFTQEEFDQESQEYADLLLEVRKTVRNGNLQKQAKAFIKSKGEELLSNLEYSELIELLDTLEKV